MSRLHVGTFRLTGRETGEGRPEQTRADVKESSFTVDVNNLVSLVVTGQYLRHTWPDRSRSAVTGRRADACWCAVRQAGCSDNREPCLSGVCLPEMNDEQ
jgi:hypothetical protein